MRFDRDDWYSIGASLGVHIVLLLLFALIIAGRPAERQLGFVEVELGPFAEGRPVQQAEQESPAEAAPEPVEEPTETEPEDPAPEPQPEPQETVAEEEAEAVELPEQEEPVEDEEQVETPEDETVAPEERPEPPEQDQPEPQTTEAASEEASGGGATEGDAGAPSGDDSEGAEEEEAAPFNIEGLNRDRLSGPLPRYAEQVNATIKVRITVGPQGRVVRRLPLMKANPALERAVMEALADWRFNALPPNAPQENQTGIVTFHFRLE